MDKNNLVNLKGYDITSINLINKIKKDKVVVFTSSGCKDIEANVVNILDYFYTFGKKVLLIDINEKYDNNDINEIIDNRLTLSNRNIVHKSFENSFCGELDKWKLNYDLIIILCSPIKDSGDAIFILGLEISDGVVLIEKKGKSTKSNIKYAINNINITNKKIYGFILD